MIRPLLCWFGYHTWQIAREVDVPSNYADDPGPVDYECGGVDYHLRCAHCPTEKVEVRRGVWLPLKYPKQQAAA